MAESNIVPPTELFASKPPINPKLSHRNHMAKVIKVKEESNKYSFALKKATAEETLKGPSNFAFIKRSSDSSNRSHFSSSCTADGSTVTTATTHNSGVYKPGVTSYDVTQAR